MPEPKTFWVTREDCETIKLHRTPPVDYGGNWATPDHDVLNHVSWPALSLPREPLPGECWEVRWSEFRPAGQIDDPIMVPTARNVTEELKEPRTDG